MEEHVHKFMELLMFLGYIRGKRVNIQSFLQGLPPSYKDRIDFSSLQTLQENIRMTTHCYEKSKWKSKVHLSWKGNPLYVESAAPYSSPVCASFW